MKISTVAATDNGSKVRLEDQLPNFAKQTDRRLVFAQLEFAGNKHIIVNNITLDAPEMSTLEDWQDALRTYGENLRRQSGQSYFTITLRADGQDLPYTWWHKLWDGWVELSGCGRKIRHKFMARPQILSIEQAFALCFPPKSPPRTPMRSKAKLTLIAFNPQLPANKSLAQLTIIK